MPPSFDDDKAPACIRFLLERLRAHQAAGADRPLFVGLNGVQGVGKTTLVAALGAALEQHGVPTVVASIDDFYLGHAAQVALARRHAGNGLLQHRGEPGTHDVPLARAVLAALAARQPTSIPCYDKAAFHGQGDRRPPSAWRPVNRPGQPPVQAVVLEGWCVGFRPLSPAAVEARRAGPSRSLRRHRLQHLLVVNDKLAAYDALTDRLDAFIHIDAEQPDYAYGWRQQQEDALRAHRGDPGAGMTPAQVVRFVDAYFPAYELYTDGLRKGVLADRPGCQLRIVVARDRSVKDVVRI